jgi:hypothetical protein
MKFKHKLITFFLLCLYGCGPKPPSNYVVSNSSLTVEKLVSHNDMPYGLFRIKIANGHLYIFDGGSSGGMVFVPDAVSQK